MARKTNDKTKPSKAAATPRQVALVLPHASAAGPSFETAMETLSSDLAVHKLWQANAPKPAKK